MQYIIVDLEATCWEDADRREEMEIIEIGAVRLATAQGPVAGEYGAFVRPAVSEINDFCQNLTSIRPEDVAASPTFPEAIELFIEWIGPEPYFLCSWGKYDLTQFERDFARHGMDLPRAFARHINLKLEFSRLRGGRPQAMKEALQRAGLPLEGKHHRGIDDARNIAKLAMLILPQLEAERAR
jgi:inhibitor of KinA sporulation pathway (predicted exonuclease)